NLANYSYPTSTYTLSLHDALPIYPQFARHPDRHQTEVAVEHVHACVGDGPADGDRSGIGLGGTGHVIAARERGRLRRPIAVDDRSEEHTSELQSRFDLVCRLLLEK